MDEAFEAVTAAVRSGRISRRELDRKVTRVLRLKYRRGVVARPFADPRKVGRVVGTDSHLATADAITETTTTVIRNDDGVLPLAVDGASVLVTGYGATTTTILADALTSRGAAVTRVETGSAPTQDKIDAAVTAAADVDTVVVLTMKAWDTTTTDPRRGQQTLVSELLATGAEVVVVAVRDPYDIAYLGDAPTYAATYSYSPSRSRRRLVC